MARSEFAPNEEYLGNGTLAAYTFDFKIEALNQLLIIEVNSAGAETHRVRGSDTTTYLSGVEFDPVAGGGTITLLAVLADQYRLIILQANDSPTQPYEFRGKRGLSLPKLEAALDWIAGSIQRLAYLGHRSVKLSDHDDPEEFDPTLPKGITTTSTLGLIPSTNAAGTAWNAITSWTPVTDLLAAVAAAAAALISQGAAYASEVAAAASAIAAAASAAAAAISETNAAGSAVSAAASSAAAVITAGAAAASAVTSANQAAASALQASNSAASSVAAAQSVIDVTAEAAAALASQNAAAISETNAANSAIAAAASAAAAATPNIVGTFAAPYACIAGTTVPFTGIAYMNKKYIKGTGGVDMSANPQIAAATNEGQTLRLIGTSDSDTVLFEDGTGLNIQGAWLAEANRVLDLDWDAGRSLWVETSRS
jgi:hypothetical protein